MNFKQLTIALKKRVDRIVKGKNRLYVVNVDKDLLYETYLSSFPEGTNPIYRERTEHDCSTCRRFIKSFGAVVAISENNDIQTIWDFETGSETYQPVMNALNELVSSHVVSDALITTEANFGEANNKELMELLQQRFGDWKQSNFTLLKSQCTRPITGMNRKELVTNTISLCWTDAKTKNSLTDSLMSS